MPSYRGIYINLDRSSIRRSAIDAQLERHGVAPLYRRFAAIDGSMLPRRSTSSIGPGEEGAFRSHAAALREAASSALPVHILEDDVVFSSATHAVIEQTIAAGLLDRFDIVFTDTFVAPDLGMLKVLTHAFDRTAQVRTGQIGLRDLQLIDVSRQNFACLTSYLVSQTGIKRLIALLDAELDSGPRLPIDLFVRQCAQAGRLTAGLLTPFVTSFNLDEVLQSTIAAGAAAAKSSVMIMAVLRYLFFVDRNLALAKACLDSTIGAQKPYTEQSGVIMRALDFILSNEFRQF